jgi:hypothetical protein
LGAQRETARESIGRGGERNERRIRGEKAVGESVSRSKATVDENQKHKEKEKQNQKQK